jgi:CheY-like chemotaxis protein
MARDVLHLRLGRRPRLPGEIMDPKKILIVDDERITLDVLNHVLSKAGYEVLTATDGSQAVSIARHEKPQLILLDIIFPPDVGHGGGIAWDGFLIIDWLRRQEEVKTVPIFVMTKGDPAQYKNRAIAKGAAAFFPKPLNHEDLLEVVRKTVGEPEQEQGDTVHINLGPGGRA